MTKDPIVNEVRAARAEMLKQAGGTLDGLAAMLRQKRKLRPTGKVVAYKPRKPAALRRAA
jgi:hypothetical protein